jgi:ribosomal protein S18 acetylase RimI-like enzyme
LNSEEITVRRATIEDVGDVIDVLESTKLAGETWKENEKWVRKGMQDSLTNKDYIMLVAVLDSKVVGFIDCVVFPSFWECAEQGLINHLFVHDAYNGKGVGAKLLSALNELADAKGIVEIHVSTEWENMKARKLYCNYGFTEKHLLLERSKKQDEAS